MDLKNHLFSHTQTHTHSDFFSIKRKLNINSPSALHPQPSHKHRYIQSHHLFPLLLPFPRSHHNKENELQRNVPCIVYFSSLLADDLWFAWYPDGILGIGSVLVQYFGMWHRHGLLKGNCFTIRHLLLGISWLNTLTSISDISAQLPTAKSGGGMA